MSEYTVRALLALEGDFIDLDTRLGELAKHLARICRPETAEAAVLIRKARRVFRQALVMIDDPLTDAVREKEMLAPAPF